mgnify:CR=1 FL=1
MTRITKNELVAINARLSAEVAELRAQLSAAKVQRHVESNARPTKEHEYATREEALAACKRLASTELISRASISVVGNTVIVRARAH